MSSCAFKRLGSIRDYYPYVLLGSVRLCGLMFKRPKVSLLTIRGCANE